MTHTEEDSLCNKLPEMRSNLPYLLIVLSLCRKGLSLLQQVAEGEGESSEFTEMEAIQLALDIAE